MRKDLLSVAGETAEHVDRVAKVTRIFMTLSDYDANHIEKVSEAAKYHDIGKAYVPYDILYKKGKLTAEEFETVKQHTVYGKKALDQIKNDLSEDVFDLAIDISLHHHERIDGKGYPDCLTENEISNEAQIVGLADVVDALLSKRCYKPAFEFDCAMNMIQNNECGTFGKKMLHLLNRAIPQLKEMYCVN